MKKKGLNYIIISIIATFFLACSPEETPEPEQEQEQETDETEEDDEPDDIPSPIANFSIEGANNFAPSKISFTNLSENASSYLWDLGDGNTSTEENISHIYNEGGTYNVTLTARNEQNDTDIINKTVAIKDIPTKLKINNIKIESIPWIDPQSSSGWDNTTGPDLIVYLLNSSDDELFKSNTYNNVTISDIPFVISSGLPITLEDFSETKKIRLYDYDWPSSDDYMGGYSFRIEQFIPVMGDGYSSEITLKNSEESELVFVLDVTWLP